MDHDERVHGLLVTCKDQINLVSILCKKGNMKISLERRKNFTEVINRKFEKKITRPIFDHDLHRF